MTDKNEITGRQAVLMFVDELPVGGDGPGIVSALLAGWKLTVGLALLAALGSIAYCLLAPKWYRAQVLIAPVKQDAMGSALGPIGGEIGGLASLVGLDIGDGEDDKKQAMARFSSREFNYEFLNTEGLVSVIFARQWDATAKRWKNPAKAPTMDDAYRYFTTRMVNIAEDRRTNLVTVTVDWTEPALARDLANKLVARINEDRRSVARAETDRNLEYLNRELERTVIVDLRQAINRLVETEIRKRMLVDVREEYAFKVIDPAVVPGARNVVRPRIALLTAAALLSGGLLGCGIALWRRRRTVPAGT